MTTFHYPKQAADCWPHDRVDGETCWMQPHARVAIRAVHRGDAACLDMLMRNAESTRGALIAQPRHRGFAGGHVLAYMQVVSHQAAKQIATIIAADLPQLGYWEPEA
jgi:hypothetical protein